MKIELTKLSQKFSDNYLINNASLSFDKNGMYFIVGPSGSGKTTLLNILGGLLKPTEGTISIDDEILDYDNANQVADFRKNIVSYVFQDYNLLNDFSVIENLEIVGCYDKDRINSVLEYIGLKEQVKSNVKLLSGGERQRLAIGRALVKNSPIIILDEPTANLDYKNAELVFSLLKKISKNKIVIIASHDTESAVKYADYLFTISKGNINVEEFNGSSKFTNLDIDDEIIKTIYQNIINSNARELIVKYGEEKEVITICKNKLYYQIIELINKYKNKDILIEYKGNINDVNSFDKNESYTPDFKILKQIKYSWHLFKNHLFRNIISTITFSLCLLLLIVQSSVMFYEVGEGCARSLRKNDISYATIQTEKYNENLMQYANVNTGKYLYDEVSKLSSSKPIPYFNATIDNLYQVKLLALEESITFNNCYINLPNDNEVVVTTYIKTLLENKTKTNITIREGEKDFNIVSIDDKYDSDIAYRYKKNEVNSGEKDVYENSYNVVFINKNSLIEILKSQEFFTSFAPVIDENTTFKNEYAGYSSRIKGNFLCGREPQNKNEIALSSTYFKRILKKDDSTLEEYEDILNKKLYFKDYRKSPNLVEYLSKINIYELVNDVTVVGVVESTDQVIYLSEELNEEYQKLRFYYGDGIVSNTMNENEIILLADNGYKFITNGTSLIYSISGFMSTNVVYILLAIEIILVIVSVLLIFLACNQNLKEKIHEVLILISIGIKKKEIVNVFIFLNLFIVLGGLITGTVLSIIGSNIINMIFMKKEVLNINFDLFSLSIYSYLLSIGISLLVLVFTTIIPLIKIKNTELSTVLKKTNN